MSILGHMKPKDNPMQGLLGTSLNNPVFKVIHRLEDHEYDIYFGLTKLTSVTDDKNSLIFKSTIAMLVNAGIKLRHIAAVFCVSFPTITKDVEAFNNATSDEELVQLLKRPGRTTYKITPEVEAYMRERSEYHKRLVPRRYIKRTIEDIRTKYGISLSRETIRRELGTVKPDAIKIHNEEEILNRPEGKEEEPQDRESGTTGYSETPERNEYAGIYLLHDLMRPVVSGITKTVRIKIPDIVHILKTWLTGILLGAVNFESFRYFNIRDFNSVSMEMLPHVGKLRDRIQELSLNQGTAFAGYLLKQNIEGLIVRDGDYYIDGHFEEYTGSAPILEGWNTKKNRVTKGNVDYQVHDGTGNPVFSHISDVFEDFREMIPVLVRRIRALHPEGRVTIIYDRGGFKTELMKKVAGYPDCAFVTWQKGFKQKEGRAVPMRGKMEMALKYNDTGNYKRYTLRYGEDRWTHDGFTCRRIVIERGRREGEGRRWSSILTNDTKDGAEVIIEKMLGRFRQENDFKKQIAHFGLDEIVSYRTISYGEAAEKDPGKKALSERYQELHGQIRELKEERSTIAAKIGIHIADAMRGGRFFVKLPASKRESVRQIVALSGNISELKKEMKSVEKKTSKLKMCTRKGMKMLDMRRKTVLQAVKITCRNIFEKGAQEFLKKYGNLRDYQKVFRLLVQQSGTIEKKDGVLTVRLNRMGRKAFQEKCDEYFEVFNNKDRRSMDGKYRLKLAWL